MAWVPAIKMTRLTTTASTGRRMNRSVNFILAILRLGSRVVAGLRLVVDLDSRPVSQLENSRRDDFLPGLHTRHHRDLVAAGGSDADELLFDPAVGFAVGSLHVLYDKNRISVGGVVDRGSGERHDRLARAQEDFRLDEHTGPELALRVSERRLNLHVAGRLVDDRVEGSHFPGERRLSGRVLFGHAHRAADGDTADLLLWQRKIHIDWIERLQRHDGRAAR